LIDQDFGLSHDGFLKYLLKLSPSQTITPPIYLSNSIQEFRVFLASRFPRLKDYILINPETITLKSLGPEFWSGLINLLNTIFPGRLLLNCSDQFRINLKISEEIDYVFLPPEYTFSAVEFSLVTVFAPSGFYHLSRYFCPNANICLITDWRDSENSYDANNNFKAKNSRQERIFIQAPINTANILRISDSNVYEECTLQIKNYITSIEAQKFHGAESPRI
jgi:hypothetical protein